MLVSCNCLGGTRAQALLSLVVSIHCSMHMRMVVHGMKPHAQVLPLEDICKSCVLHTEMVVRGTTPPAPTLPPLVSSIVYSSHIQEDAHGLLLHVNTLLGAANYTA